MLEYRRREEGRRAGLTSSPDFFRTSEGLNGFSSSSLSSEPCVGDSSNCCLGFKIAVSVDDRECEIFLASALSAVGEVDCECGSDSVCDFDCVCLAYGSPVLSGDPVLF